MISKSFKVFQIDNKQFKFNSFNFMIFFRNYRLSKKIKASELEEKIAVQAHVSEAAVHNWLYNKNGPADLDAIKAIADCLSIKDFRLLMEEVKDVAYNNSLTSQEKESVYRIYSSVISFLDEFERTNGFNDYWLDIADKYRYEQNGCAHILNELESVVYKKYRDVILVYKREYIFLKSHPIYNELSNVLFQEDGIEECFVNKLGYAYRFEAIVEDKNGNRENTVSEDYELSLNKINAVVDKYL